MSYRCRGWSTTRNDRCEHLVREPDGWCRQCSETRPAGGGPAVSRLKHQASLLDADDVGRTGEIDIEQLAASLPVETFEVLYHVGTMDPTDKGRVCQSLEGDGLSVSVDPDDWRAIAELGGDPQWALTKPGNRLLGIHELSEGQRAGIREWAVNEGWLEPATLWQVSYTDTEVEDRRSMVFDDKEQAQGEFDEKREWEPDSEPEMTQVEGAAATAKLRQRVMNSCPPGSAEEYAQLVFTVDIAGMDGVWWADRYTPAELSCPRGVIAPHALSSFRVARDEHSGVADDLYPHLDEIAAIASGWEPDWDEVFEGPSTTGAATPAGASSPISPKKASRPRRSPGACGAVTTPGSSWATARSSTPPSPSTSTAPMRPRSTPSRSPG